MGHVPTIAERLQSKLREDPDGHLIFTGAVDQAGYGLLWDGRRRNNSRTHRLAYELKHGPVPDGFLVHHVCRIPACCNVDHLELVSARAHTLHHRGAEKCVNGHPYGPNNTHYVRQQKICVICRNAASSRYRNRNRDAINERKRARRRAAASP